MREILFHPEAEEEMNASAQFYEDRAQGLGAAFLDELQRGVYRISEAPDRYPIFSKGIRRFILDRFPFSILYTIRDNEIVIIAIMHHHRRPKYWRRRL